MAQLRPRCQTLLITHEPSYYLPNDRRRKFKFSNRLPHLAQSYVIYGMPSKHDPAKAENDYICAVGPDFFHEQDTGGFVPLSFRQFKN